MATTKKDQSEELVEAAKASAKAATENRDKPKLRTRGGGLNSIKLEPSDIPYPEGIHGDDFEDYGPTGFAAVIPEGTDIAPYSGDQEFLIDPERVSVLFFDRPGRNLPKKRLYNIKGIHKNGTFVQLAFEQTVQNNAGGDPEDAIGLRRYARKGIHVLVHDWETLRPIYCGAWDCWARAAEEGNFVGFCSLKHAKHTKPNQYKGADKISQGLMEAGVTTSSIWGS